MKNIFGANISDTVSSYFLEKLNSIETFEEVNKQLFDDFGILNFYNEETEFDNFKEILYTPNLILQEPDRAEYGDYQTNIDLSKKATTLLVSKSVSPEIIIEPTCGKGNFITASLQSFSTIQNIFGIEIYKPYVWETKFNIIHFFLTNNFDSKKPQIEIIHGNVFDFDFKGIAHQYATKKILIIGNPPWVMNSTLGSLNSKNLPKKNNFKNHAGLDAMTGKGNFDIAEYITLTLIRTFQKMKGHLFFLVKNSVIKNILFEQARNHFEINTLEKYSIDSKKEFNVSVESSIFYGELNSNPSYECKELDFYNSDNQIVNSNFGWSENKFVSNIGCYSRTKEIDGESPFVWRQGMKHDCTLVMELEKENGHYVNGLNEEIKLEDELVYALLKSSDLKNTVINQTRKYTIVTQKKVGQDTQYIKKDFPQTFQYLSNHHEIFGARKSSIYNNKPAFSIFGIGDYSFKPFKVAISGLYKTFHFTLILPQSNKPVMLDDTCYLLGFDKIEYAIYTLILLNSEVTKSFLQSITFSDAKRTFTKDILMRIDILKLSQLIDVQYIESELLKLNEAYNLSLTLSEWNNFLLEMKPVGAGQFSLF
jgi:hypothetical protein